MRELATNIDTEKPTMESILEFNRPQPRDPTVESMPHANTQAYNSTYEGADLLSKLMDDDSEDTRARRHLAKEQTGMETPLRSSSAFCSPTIAWPIEED